MESVKIRCSEGVFTKEEFLAYLGISYVSFRRYIAGGKENGHSEEEIIEDLILCNKIRKKFNLRLLPSKDTVVECHGDYYPSVSYWARMHHWAPTEVSNLLAKGLTLEEIEGIFVNKKKIQHRKGKEEGERHKCRSENELYAFYKSREDDKVKISKKCGCPLIINVLGVKTYTSIRDLAEDYGISRQTVYKRLNRGYSFSKAIGLGEKEERSKSFFFLDLKFDCLTDFCNYYNIGGVIARSLLSRYGKEGVEELFIWLNSIEKESGINLPSDFKWDYLLKMSSWLRYNKEDIVYQIKNLNKLDSGCAYYFGGKSYKGLTDVLTELRIRGTFGYEMFLKEKVPLYVIADIVAGVNIPKLTYKSPSTYLYFYYRDTFHNLNIDYEIDDIRSHLKKGYTADEILSTRKNCLFLIESSGVNRKHFIQSKLNGIVSKERMVGFFNSTVNKGDNHILSMKKAFLQYSEVEIMKEAYRVNDTEYFLCKEGNELKYLSGTELVDIALESVKGKIGSDGENN